MFSALNIKYYALCTHRLYMLLLYINRWKTLRHTKKWETFEDLINKTIWVLDSGSLTYSPTLEVEGKEGETVIYYALRIHIREMLWMIIMLSEIEVSLIAGGQLEILLKLIRGSSFHNSF